jgi:hypothetical protein
MRLKLGIFASSGAAFFKGVVNWLIGADSGKLFASEDGTKFVQIDTEIFGTSDVNDLMFSFNSDQLIPNQTSWQTSTLVNGTTATAFGIQYVNDKWFLFQGTRYPLMSTNAISWTTIGITPSTASLTTWPSGYNWYGATKPTKLKGSYYVNNQYYLSINPGSANQPLTSTDNINWQFTGTNRNFISIKDGNNLSVGASESFIYTSTDKISWTTRTSNFGFTLITSIAYGNSLWVAAGHSGQLRTSTDAITWVTRTSNFSDIITDIAYNNGLWIAVGSRTNAAPPNHMRSSTNAITWTTVVNTSRQYSSVINVNNLWITTSVNSIQTSTDSITWTTIYNSFAQNAEYNNEILAAAEETLAISSSLIYPGQINGFIATGNDGKLARSSDGLSWSTINTGDTTDINVINYGGQGPVSVGVVWTTMFVPTNNFTTQEIAYGQGRWVFTDGIIFSSTNLISWTTIGFPESLQYQSVAYGNNQWLVGAINPMMNYYRFYRSTNGITWTTTTYPNINSETVPFGNPGPPTVSYGNGLWLIGYSRPGFDNILRRSTDLINWTTTLMPVPGNNYADIWNYINNMWIMIDSRSIVYTSTNAISWTTRWNQSTNRSPIFRTASGQGIIIQPLGGSSPNQLISTDGISWATRNSVPNAVGYLAYGNGLWYSSGNGVKVSTDSISWTTVWEISNGRGIAYGNNRWVVTGNVSQNAYSDPINNDFRSYFIGVE